MKTEKGNYCSEVDTKPSAGWPFLKARLIPFWATVIKTIKLLSFPGYLAAQP